MPYDFKYSLNNLIFTEIEPNFKIAKVQYALYRDTLFQTRFILDEEIQVEGDPDNSTYIPTIYIKCGIGGNRGFALRIELIRKACMNLLFKFTDCLQLDRIRHRTSYSKGNSLWIEPHLKLRMSFLPKLIKTLYTFRYIPVEYSEIVNALKSHDTNYVTFEAIKKRIKEEHTKYSSGAPNRDYTLWEYYMGASYILSRSDFNYSSMVTMENKAFTLIRKKVNYEPDIISELNEQLIEAQRDEGVEPKPTIWRPVYKSRTYRKFRPLKKPKPINLPDYAIAILNSPEIPDSNGNTQEKKGIK